MLTAASRSGKHVQLDLPGFDANRAVVTDRPGQVIESAAQADAFIQAGLVNLRVTGLDTERKDIEARAIQLAFDDLDDPRDTTTDAPGEKDKTDEPSHRVPFFTDWQGRWSLSLGFSARQENAGREVTPARGVRVAPRTYEGAGVTPPLRRFDRGMNGTTCPR